MMYTYFALLTNNIELQEPIDSCNLKYTMEFLGSVIEPIESLIVIITNLFIAITGVFAINYFKKLKEKNINATFGFYSRLIVRLYTLELLLKNYKSYIIDKFLPESERSEINPAMNVTVKNAIEELTSTAEETLEFLKHEEDQMPASRNWPQYYIQLLAFLEDCKKIKNEKYFNPNFVNNRSEISKNVDDYEKNINNMISYILKRQKEIANKLYNKQD